MSSGIQPNALGQAFLRVPDKLSPSLLVDDT